MVKVENRVNKKGYVLCSKCKKYKSPEDFPASGIKNRVYHCKKCCRIYRNRKKGDINRLIDAIYNHQKHSGEPMAPGYTWEALNNFLMREGTFLNLYKKWVGFDLDKRLTPSVMRKDPTKPFSTDNLMILTMEGVRNETVLRKQRAVIQYSLDGIELARYPNAKMAAKLIGNVYYQNIHRACRNAGKSAAGFLWEYA